ncbi:GTPase LSG1-1 isoform X1 [Selaginella moellendorffii]|nr:GTPase LSG1-1 isoform X1 [Selaginella moellendorffii]|eukprot:XP_002985785.2 GTPase LSG1-1 isoform X1 [Selaginella moellendorffii]
MGGKKGSQVLGKALIKRRNADKQHHHHRDDKAGASALQSVMEFTDLQVVLEQAEEAERIFSDANPPPQLVSREESSSASYDEDKRREEVENESSLTVPRRPKWHKKMTVEELDTQERQAFLEWRRNLARLEENEKLVITPFEKNLEVWRQLWRVIERCDLVVMVVDARNPLFYRCPDLEAYVKEIDENKTTLLLLNKSDLLPVAIRKKWASYFDELGLDYIFWSAKSATAKLEGKDDDQDLDEADDGDVPVLGREELLASLQVRAEGIRQRRSAGQEEKADSSFDTSSSVMDTEKRVAVGFVGYPNVGKSSTINVLVGEKRTGVTSTPGKTKHFQTLIINDRLMLCDCPGLVFPSFTSSKADMVAAGVLPVDKMTDYRGPIQVIANQIPRRQLEETYGLLLPKPKPYEDQNRPPTAAELLKSYAQSRGYVASRGLPDETRSARQMLKDYLNGKLLYCHTPPDDDTTSDDESNDDDEEAVDEGGVHSDDVDDLSGEEDEEYEEREEEEEEGSKTTTGTGESNLKARLDGIFRDVDLNASKSQGAKAVKPKKALHKMQKKAPRKKDRSWRVKDDESDGMARVKGISVSVSYGAAR